jgi:hypothetical protein
MFLVFAILALVGAGCSSGMPPGMKLLRMEVYQEERLILRTTFDAPDHKEVADFWRRAGERPFASDREFDRVNFTENTPLRAVIQGHVRIRILHVKHVLTSATLENLKLVRETQEDSLWYLPEDEVERVKQAAGL